MQNDTISDPKYVFKVKIRKLGLTNLLPNSKQVLKGLTP